LEAARPSLLRFINSLFCSKEFPVPDRAATEQSGVKWRICLLNFA